MLVKCLSNIEYLLCLWPPFWKWSGADLCRKTTCSFHPAALPTATEWVPVDSLVQACYRWPVVHELVVLPQNISVTVLKTEQRREQVKSQEQGHDIQIWRGDNKVAAVPLDLLRHHDSNGQCSRTSWDLTGPQWGCSSLPLTALAVSTEALYLLNRGILLPLLTFTCPLTCFLSGFYSACPDYPVHYHIFSVSILDIYPFASFLASAVIMKERFYVKEGYFPHSHLTLISIMEQICKQIE
jgi:hypothetical protein